MPEFAHKKGIKKRRMKSKGGCLRIRQKKFNASSIILRVKSVWCVCALLLFVHNNNNNNKKQNHTQIPSTCLFSHTPPTPFDKRKEPIQQWHMEQECHPRKKKLHQYKKPSGLTCVCVCVLSLSQHFHWRLVYISSLQNTECTQNIYTHTRTYIHTRKRHTLGT